MRADLSDSFDPPPRDPNLDRPDPVPVSPKMIRLHGFIFLALIAVSVIVVFVLLDQLSCGPLENAEDKCEDAATSQVKLLGFAVFSGAAGGMIHAATSFTVFVGNRELVTSWIWWFYLRAPIAALLATLVYFGIRAGVFGDGEVRCCDDVYMVGFMAGLAGLFSKQVTDKLSDLVDVLFTPSKPLKRADALGAPRPPTRDGAAAQFEEAVQRVQQLLIELDHLPVTRDGVSSANGMLDDATRAAIDQFLAEQGIEGTDRQNTLGQETDPDFWPRLTGLLEEAVESAGSEPAE